MLVCEISLLYFGDHSGLPVRKKNGVTPLSSWKNVFFGAKNIFEISRPSRGKEQHNNVSRCNLSRRIELAVQKCRSSYHLGEQSGLVADFRRKKQKSCHSLLEIRFGAPWSGAKAEGLGAQFVRLNALYKEGRSDHRSAAWLRRYYGRIAC